MSLPPTNVLDGLDWPVKTDRLILRRAVSSDADAVFEYRSLEAVGRWLTVIETDPGRWAQHWPKRMPTTVVAESEDELIGDLRLVIRDAQAQGEVVDQARGVEAELMWAFHPDHHGKGYATEAVSALIELSFSVLGLRRLVAVCFAENEPSWRLMERVGMHREARHVQSTLHREGDWRDFLSYALLAP
ncbi:MAG TPA: GNAT family N-acetyltransferase [Solirubrobacteraceae bacterium]|nr:GNAT family N-acetyltransferase [Solirubrobacteraceae bacterium]